MPVQGLIGRKIGTTQVFRDTGEAVSVTAVRAGPCIVTWVKSPEKDGYSGVQLGYEEVDSLRRPEQGHLTDDPEKGRAERAGKLFRYLREFRVDDIEGIEVGQQVDVGLFEPGEVVDVVGFSKGRGFAGGVKRHGFRGGPKTHGQSDRHRAPGSIGAGSTPGRVIKGLRMAGRMGAARVTSRNIEVIAADAERNLVLVKGSVPGARNSMVLVSRTKTV